jgi:hypothetical protein
VFNVTTQVAFVQHLCNIDTQENYRVTQGQARRKLARRSASHPLVGNGLLRRIQAQATILIECPGCLTEVIEAHLSSMTLQAAKELNEPRSLYWTCLLGLKSWAQLDYTERDNWETCVGYLKGFDFRDEELQCRSITELAEWKIRYEREDTMVDKVKEKKRREIGEIISTDLAANPATQGEWESAIARQAVQAYRQGYLLLAVAPDLQAEKAASLMEKVYGSTRRRYAKPKQRARWQNWLHLIASFEDAETSHKAFAQEFARFRRALEGIHFA